MKKILFAVLFIPSILFAEWDRTGGDPDSIYRTMTLDTLQTNYITTKSGDTLTVIKISKFQEEIFIDTVFKSVGDSIYFASPVSTDSTIRGNNIILKGEITGSRKNTDVVSRLPGSFYYPAANAAAFGYDTTSTGVVACTYFDATTAETVYTKFMLRDSIVSTDSILFFFIGHGLTQAATDTVVLAIRHRASGNSEYKGGTAVIDSFTAIPLDINGDEVYATRKRTYADLGWSARDKIELGIIRKPASPKDKLAVDYIMTYFEIVLPYREH